MTRRGQDPITDLDNDVNDIDQSDLINVAGCANLTMDDFTLDVTAIGDLFNGRGNDMMFDVNQINDMVDNDNLCDPMVQYRPNGTATMRSRTSTHGGGATPNQVTASRQQPRQRQRRCGSGLGR